MWKKILFTLFCIVYGITLTLILLVLRFPEERFLAYASDHVVKRLPGFSCSIAEVTYHFPLELSFTNLRLSNQSELIDLDLAELRISLDKSDPTRRAHLFFELFGGRVETDIILDYHSGSFELPELSVQGIKLGSIEPLQQRLARPVEGILHLSGRYLVDGSDFVNGSFDGDVRITDLLVRLRRPILQSEELRFEELNGAITMAQKKIVIADGVARGAQYSGNFSGVVTMAGQWQESTLAVHGELLPQDSYVEQNQQVAKAVELLYKKYGREEIPYRIDGSFREPRFQFGGDVQRVL